MPRYRGSYVWPRLSAAPSSPVAGQVYFNTTDNKFYAHTGSTWLELGASTGGGPVTFRTVHTFAIPGTVTAADPNIDFFFSKTAGQTSNIVKARYHVNTGTNVTFKIQKNGADWTGYGTTATPLTATTTDAETVQTNSLADNDELTLDIVGVSGTPAGLHITVVLEHTV